ALETPGAVSPLAVAAQVGGSSLVAARLASWDPPPPDTDPGCCESSGRGRCPAGRGVPVLVTHPWSGPAPPGAPAPGSRAAGPPRRSRYEAGTESARAGRSAEKLAEVLLLPSHLSTDPPQYSYLWVVGAGWPPLRSGDRQR